MKYVMVTGLPNHWDKVSGKTSYAIQMLHGPIMDPKNIVEHTPTIFIKTDRLGLVKKTWEGEILSKKMIGEKVWFEFRLSKTIECPPQYTSFRQGWYVDETE